ncbi:anti-sigma factor domain-containing protein [Fictibacillus halophilus]|uniref:anti-sigma factor n=1 Tax=Fictibacillus halophilus TaxID=1610490 RepID=UPI001CF9473C|nr:anti-sigma factor [Fictibacillus halophilus]
MDKKMCDQLLDYYNGILSDEEKAAFESHLKDCPACQEELAEWQELTSDLPLLSDEVEPPTGMKQRILSNVFEDEESVAIEETKRSATSITGIDSVRSETPRKKSGWLTGLLAAGLLLSLGMNAYLFAENEKNEQVIEEQMSKTYKSVQLVSEQSDSAGIASMVQKDEKMNLVVQTHNMTQVQGKEVYQVWLIEGDKKYRAGTFIPDEKGNGAVVFTVNFPGEHKWDAVAISHEPTPDSKQPKGTIVMASNL